MILLGLPSIQVLEFPHGILCEISCEPDCSNVFALRAFVANYGDAKYCDAQIVEVDNKVSMSSKLPRYGSRYFSLREDSFSTY